MVNLDRALYAAKLSVTYSLNYSVEQSKIAVADVPTPKMSYDDKDAFVLPLQSLLSF